MKKVFGILLIILGIVTFVRCISPNFWESLGAFIGVSLICFLPSYFLLRNKKKE